MRILRRSLALALGAFALAGPAAARAQGAAAPDTRPTVAVIDFTNGAIGRLGPEMEPLRQGVADLLATELAGNPGIRIVERTQIKAAMAELQLGQSATVDAATAVQLGRLLNAHHMVTGVFVTDAKGRMRLATRAFSVETGKIAWTTTVNGKSDDVLDLVDQTAARLHKGLALPRLEARARPASAAPARKSAVPFQAVMLYSRAVQALDRQDRAGAVQLFRASLDRFPDYEAARKQLARLEQAAATKPGA